MHSQPTPPARGTFLSRPSPAIRERRARGPLTACKQRYLPRPNGQGDAYCKNHPSDASPDLDRPPHATDIRQLTAPRLKTSHTRTRCVTRHDAAPPAASGPTSPSERGAPAVLAGRPHNPMPNPGLDLESQIGGQNGCRAPGPEAETAACPGGGHRQRGCFVVKTQRMPPLKTKGFAASEAPNCEGWAKIDIST